MPDCRKQGSFHPALSLSDVQDLVASPASHVYITYVSACPLECSLCHLIAGRAGTKSIPPCSIYMAEHGVVLEGSEPIGFRVIKVQKAPAGECVVSLSINQGA